MFERYSNGNGLYKDYSGKRDRRTGTGSLMSLIDSKYWEI